VYKSLLFSRLFGLPQQPYSFAVLSPGTLFVGIMQVSWIFLHLLGVLSWLGMHWFRLPLPHVVFAFLRLLCSTKYCRAQNGIDEMCRDQWKWASNNPNGYRSEAEQSLDSKPSTNGNHEAVIIKGIAT
jgi:hypothetical protein